MSEENKLSEFESILEDKKIIKIDGKDVIIDPSRLQFNEANIVKYLEEEAVWYANYGRVFAEAEAELQFCELKEEEMYYAKVVKYKEEGATDKLAEAKAKSDPELVEVRRNVIVAKTKAKMLQQHLRAWDKCHENANNRSNTLRKEMDKMGIESTRSSSLDEQINSIIGTTL